MTPGVFSYDSGSPFPEGVPVQMRFLPGLDRVSETGGPDKGM